jgi:hypothetical protein
LNIHIYIGLVLFFFSPPSSSSSSCIPSTCRDDDRQRRGRSETAYQVKQIFRFFFLFSFILNSLCSTISAPMHSAYIYIYIYIYISVFISVNSKWERALKYVQFSQCEVHEWRWPEQNIKERTFVSSLLNFSSFCNFLFRLMVMSHQWYHCHVTWYWTIIIKRSIINIEMQSLNRRLWLLADLIRRWVYVHMISRCLRAMMTLIRRTTNISRSIACIYANLYFSFSLCV